MRGNPVKEWILFSVFWLALLFPVIRLTAEKPDRPPPVAIHQREATLPTCAIIRTTQIPRTIKIQQAGQILFETDNPSEAELHVDIQMRMEDRHVELLVLAVWPDASPGPHVLELAVAPDGFDERVHHAWGDGTLEDIFTYSWEQVLVP